MRSDFEDSNDSIGVISLARLKLLLLLEWKTLRQAYYPYFTTRAYQNQRHEMR